MLAFIMLLLYMLGAIAGLYKVNNPWGKLTLIVYLLLSLISLLDNVNARFFRSSHWYIASTVIWVGLTRHFPFSLNRLTSTPI